VPEHSAEVHVPARDVKIGGTDTGQVDSNQALAVAGPRLVEDPGFDDRDLAHGRDHPHVGDEALVPEGAVVGGDQELVADGRHPVSPWGTPTKGYKTRSNKRTDNMIVRRRKRK